MATEKRLISADFLFDRVLDRIYEHLEKGECDLAAECNNILGILVGTPAADAVEVAHGRWIWDTKYSDYACSVCHHWDLKTPNYCSSCGAKMDGGADNGS